MRKHLLNYTLTKPRKKAEPIWKTHELFIYGDLGETGVSCYTGLMVIQKF